MRILMTFKERSSQGSEQDEEQLKGTQLACGRERIILCALTHCLVRSSCIDVVGEARSLSDSVLVTLTQSVLLESGGHVLRGDRGTTESIQHRRV